MLPSYRWFIQSFDSDLAKNEKDARKAHKVFCQELTGAAPHLCFFPTTTFIIAPKTSLCKFAT